MPRRDDYDDYDRHEDDEDRPARRRRREPDDRDDEDEDRPRARGDEPDDDYEDDDRPRRRRGGGRRARARERVMLPAIFLMVAGGLGLALGVLNVVLEIAGVGGQNPFVNPQQANDPQFQKIEKITNVVGPILNILWGLIVLFGGWQMRNLKSRGFVVFSCIWAMLPCNGCCLLGIPIGIWALVVLNDENVKRAF